MPRLLHELFECALARDPAKVAVELPGTLRSQPTSLLTYADLVDRAARLRRALHGYVQQECVVAIALPKDSPSVHAAQLAVLQAGAAFVCVDLAFPDEHMGFILRDAKAVVVLADARSCDRLRSGAVGAEQVLDVDACEVDACEVGDVSEDLPPPSWLSPRSLAYVIYTSGTTGRPKGVMVEHHSVVHLLEAEQTHLKLQPHDRCVQVSSNAYDSSIEECWLPFAAGATVVVAADDVTRLGPDLVPWLREHRITVLMPTPTMLRATGCASPASELPELRLVYTGGEAISQDLVDRWAHGLQLENGYGPTECTVTVTRARLRAHAPITIGRAIGESRVHVLDDRMQPVAVGASGELCLSGPCLARGYLDRPTLTAERFPDHAQLGRIYRTGDLVLQDEHGDLHYLGRIDAQVKVRGYRIELSAIEAHLVAIDGVRAAACKVQGEAGREMIVAWLAMVDGRPQVEGKALANRLRAALPDYMVPSRFAVMQRLPILVSGKLDRAALPDIGPDSGPSTKAARCASGPGRAVRSPLEERLAKAFALVLQLEVLAVDADFFELGGNSLRAAELITQLRRVPDTAGLAVRDVYEYPTVAALSARALACEPMQPSRQRERKLRGRPVLVTCVQSLWLTALLLTGSGAAYVAIYMLLPWLLQQLGLWPLLLLAPLMAVAVLAVYLPLAMVVVVVLKRVLIGRYRAVRAPVWSGLYLRNWLVVRCVRLLPWSAVQGTELFNIGLRLLGARIGKRVHVHRGVDLMGGGWDLLTLADDVTLSQDALVGLVEYDEGEIVFGEVAMAEGSTLDVRAGLQGNSSLGRYAHVSALSNVLPGTHVPDEELWDGVPAVRVGVVPDVHVATCARPAWSPIVYAWMLLLARSVLACVMALPSITLIAIVLLTYDVTGDQALAWVLQPTSNLMLFGGAILLSVATVASGLCISVLLLRFTRPVAAGNYRLHSSDYLRIWLRTGLLESAGRWLSGSLYWRWWLRLAGMKLGRNCEISTIIDVLPEQVTIGDETFFADGVYLAGPRLRGGIALVAPTLLSPRSFVGNHAVVHAGTSLPSDILIGVATVADAACVRTGSSWFGHPAIELPQREVVELDRSLTHDPTKWLYVQRLLWESLRFVLPAVMALAGLCWIDAATRLGLLWMPLLSLAVFLGLVLMVWAAKWLLLGRVRPGTHGLWSSWCCRWDFLYMAWGMLAHGPLSPLAGTLLLPFYLRAMGMRIGKHVVLAGSFEQVVDPDMLTIEDGATVDPMFQAHTFEDRVLKIGPVHIGKNATVGRATVLFYGSNVEAGCKVSPHSVVMKNETLSAGQQYAGCPTRPMRNR